MFWHTYSVCVHACYRISLRTMTTTHRASASLGVFCSFFWRSGTYFWNCKLFGLSIFTCFNLSYHYRVVTRAVLVFLAATAAPKPWWWQSGLCCNVQGSQWTLKHLQWLRATYYMARIVLGVSLNNRRVLHLLAFYCSYQHASVPKHVYCVSFVSSPLAQRCRLQLKRFLLLTTESCTRRLSSSQSTLSQLPATS